MADSFSDKVAIGIAWMTAARVAARILGLISTLVLARLLTPADFGLVAMATAVAAGLELLTLFGFDTALIQRKELAREHYDSAWTLNILIGAGLAAAMAVAAAPVARFYTEPRLEMVMFVIGGKYIFEYAVNPGTVDFRRKLSFRPDFVMQVAPKLAGILVTIPLAVWLHDFRALLVGMFLSSIVKCGLSYLMHPHRPSWCLSEARGLFGFSRWLLLSNFLTFLRGRSADLIIGRALGPGSLGLYSVASEIGTLPSTEMVAPINRVLFPSYVLLAEDPERLRDAFRATLGLIALAVLPASFGIAAVADPLVRVMLGGKWLAAIPLIALLAIAGVGSVLQTNLGSVHNALGQPRMVALTGAIQVAFLVPTIFVATVHFGLEGLAWALVVYAFAIGLPVAYGVLFRTTPIRLTDVLHCCWRPVVGSVLMYGAVRGLLGASNPGVDLIDSIVALLVSCLVGALTYFAAVAALWSMAGRPPGSESELLSRIQSRIRRSAA